MYVSQEQREQLNITLHMLDAMTYGAILRQYVESINPQPPSTVVDIVTKTNFPYVGWRERIPVLKWLVDRFTETKLFRDWLKAPVGSPDAYCRDCAQKCKLYDMHFSR